MHRRRPLLALALFAFVLAMPPHAAAQQPEGEPQRELPTEPLAIETQRGGVYHFTVEMALTRQQQAMGLMFRESLGADRGMLFVFDPPRRASFWMRNTLISLDMLFIAPDGRILNIARRTEPLSEESRPSDGIARGVLELRGGLTELLGIRAGDRVLHPAFGAEVPPEE
ncbi:MAG: DUF192 domain-containing protein [Azospirillaceae bacterium]